MTALPRRRGKLGAAALMQLRLSDPSYTDRLATYLRSLGQTVFVDAVDHVDVDAPDTESARNELAIYLRVWSVLYPDADVQLLDAGDEPPVA